MTMDKHTVTLHCFAFHCIVLHALVHHNSIMYAREQANNYYLQFNTLSRRMIALLFLGLPIFLSLPASRLINNVANVHVLHSSGSNLSNHLTLSLTFLHFSPPAIGNYSLCNVHKANWIKVSKYNADQCRSFISFHLLMKWFSLAAISIVLSILVYIALTLLLSPSLSQHESRCIPGWNRHLKETK